MLLSSVYKMKKTKINAGWRIKSIPYGDPFQPNGQIFFITVSSFYLFLTYMNGGTNSQHINKLSAKSGQNQKAKYRCIVSENSLV